MNTRHSLIFPLFIFGLLNFSAPALAIPLPGDYTLESTAFDGTFTVGTVGPGLGLTEWMFTTNIDGAVFSGFPLFPVNTALEINNEDSFIQHTPRLPSQSTAPLIVINWFITMGGLTTTIYFDPDQMTHGGTDATIAAVPIPNSILLFASGIAGLAGYRWHQRRREGTQVG